MTAPDFVDLAARPPRHRPGDAAQVDDAGAGVDSRVEEGANKVEVRVCHELLRLAREQMLNDNAARLRPAPKHADVASRINTHREAVSRLFSKLTKLGVVQRGRGELVIRDVQALAAYARQLHGT